MDSSQFQILITRPQPENQISQDYLRDKGWSVSGRSVLEIVPDLQLSAESLHQTLSQYDTIVAVSSRAVNLCAKQLFPYSWPTLSYFAVGDRSATPWRELGLEVQTPVEACSEDLLTSLLQHKPSTTKTLILRGHGGREWLAEQLREHGCQVDYLDCYHRKPIALEPEQLIHWTRQGINTIVCSSGAVFDALHHQTTSPPFCTWLKSCNLLLPSQRVCQQADALGYTNTWNCHGASDAAVHQMLLELAHRLKES